MESYDCLVLKGYGIKNLKTLASKINVFIFSKISSNMASELVTVTYKMYEFYLFYTRIIQTSYEIISTMKKNKCQFRGKDNGRSVCCKRRQIYNDHITS